MHRTRAITHLTALVDACTTAVALPGALPLRALWVSGELLDGGEPEQVDVVLGVDLPVEEVPWGCPPPGARHFADATRLTRMPLRPLWRSTRGEVGNQAIVRPLLLWTSDAGPRPEALDALGANAAEELREPALDPGADTARHAAETALARTALRTRLARYDADRWSPAGAVTAADDLAAAVRGLLDLDEVTKG